MSGALFIVAGCILAVTIASFVRFLRNGPRGVRLVGHKHRHHCLTPDLCDDANTCVMLCHEKNCP